MHFRLSILGSNAAKPDFGRHPTSQLLQINNRSYLIDCGEGTQLRIQNFKHKPGKIDAVFISHLHGDHFLGLYGLLDSFALSGRKKPFSIFGPADLEKLLNLHREVTGARYPYPIQFNVVPREGQHKIFANNFFEVTSFPLIHRKPCTGFLFKELPKERNIIGPKIQEYSIPYSQLPLIKKGADFVMNDGTIIPNSEISIDPRPSKSYAYCTDTSFCTAIIPIIKNVDLLYHEATYLKDVPQAAERGHSTSVEAAEIAKLANAKKLLLGHFSSKYFNLEPFEKEARTVFKESYNAVEGLEIDLTTI